MFVCNLLLVCLIACIVLFFLVVIVSVTLINVFALFYHFFVSGPAWLFLCLSVVLYFGEFV